MGDQQKRVRRLQKNLLSKLKDSVQHYDQPFEPVGVEGWEAALLDDPKPPMRIHWLHPLQRS